MSTLAELSIFPLGKGASLSPFVAKVVKIIQDSGLDYELGAMGSCIEGEWDEVMNVVDKCFKAMEADSERIYINLKIDYRKGRKGGLKRKVEAVQEKLKL